jgi:hypothetical protein
MIVPTSASLVTKNVNCSAEQLTSLNKNSSDITSMIVPTSASFVTAKGTVTLKILVLNKLLLETKIAATSPQ